MLSLRHKLAWRYFKNHNFKHDDRRNLRLGGIVSLYGIAFALEKLLIVIGYPLPDFGWLIIYGACALLSSFWWIEDAILDLWEDNTIEDEKLEGFENHEESDVARAFGLETES